MGAKELFIGSISWLFLVPLLGLPMLVLGVYKLILILIVKCFRKDLVLFSGLDVMQCPGSSHEKSTMNFGFVLKVVSSIKVGQLRDLWKEKFLGDDLQGLLGYENFTQCVEIFGGYSFGKKVKIESLDKQIQARSIEDGKCLEEVIDEWLLEKYEKDCPCWEVIVVPLTNSNATAVAFKIHHAFADGYSVLNIIDKLTDNQSPYLVKNTESNWIRQGLTLLEAPAHMGKMKPDPHNIFACKKAPMPRWIVSFLTLDLRILKQIRQFHKVHLASVVMSIVAGALKKYSIETGMVTEDKVPIDFLMASPVAWPKHPAKVYKTHPKLCNHWTNIMYRTSTKDDPCERLRETEKSYKASVECGIADFFFRCVCPMMGLLPTSLMNKMLGDSVGVVGGYSVTVGGDNYKLLGSDITHINNIIAMFDVIPTLPISIFSFSHSNKMEITLSANPERFPDRKAVEKLESYIQDELERLRLLSINA